MPIHPINKSSVSDEAFEQIKNNIVSGEWPRGSKIPSETELANTLGVSRITVRNAIHRLVGMGVLNVRRGDGTFVSDSVSNLYYNSLLPVLMQDKYDLEQVLELRMIIETASASLAAQRANAQDIASLREYTRQMEQHFEELEVFSSNDLDFHYGIALATKNQMIVKVQAVIYDVLNVAMKEAVNIVGYEAGIYYHTKIIEAIECRDSAKAEKYMRQHISNVVKNKSE